MALTDYKHFYLDLRSGGFWPVTLDDDHEPTALGAFRVDSTTESPVVLGCRDGYLRRFDPDVSADDGVTVTSHVWIGPVHMGRHDLQDGIISELTAVLDAESGDVDWGLYVAKTPEAVFSASAFVSGTWVAGDNYSTRPRARGPWLAIRLENGDTSAWTLERITAVLQGRGRTRKA